MRGDPCPAGGRCTHNHCMGDCIEQAYDREAPRVDAELWRRHMEKINSPKPGEK